MKRISVIGSSGSGKTTLARTLAVRLGVPHIELDALHFGPDWTEVPWPLFRERVLQAISAPEWVIDGNYPRTRDEVLAAADTVIWLDTPLLLNLWRLSRRSFRRIAAKEELWHGNRESLRTAIGGRDSLFGWLILSHRDRRRRYAEMLPAWEQAGKTVHRFRTPRELREWLVRAERGLPRC